MEHLTRKLMAYDSYVAVMRRRSPPVAFVQCAADWNAMSKEEKDEWVLPEFKGDAKEAFALLHDRAKAHDGLTMAEVEAYAVYLEKLEKPKPTEETCVWCGIVDAPTGTCTICGHVREPQAQPPPARLSCILCGNGPIIDDKCSVCDRSQVPMK